ncbi:hypothetical protein KJ762_07590 [bacterium]|nr:hypothetical protein [bacterium]MBU1634356.1 hypothetical protein [bacterium]MBU1900942.1 hypothetical protein [Patescibacteria group bacterium]
MNKIRFVSLGLGLLLIFAFHNTFASDFLIDGTGSMCVASSQLATAACPTGFILNEGKICVKADLWCKNDFDYNSFFDTETNSCACMDGFFEQDGECIPGGKHCRAVYGPNARYISSDGSCGCNKFYVLDGEQCVTGTSYCSSYGSTVTFSSEVNACVCRTVGYVYNEIRKSCIPKDASCDIRFGEHVVPSGGSDCQCEPGYEWNHAKTKCVYSFDRGKLSERLDYFLVRKRIACDQTKSDQGRCFWTRIELSHAGNVLGVSVGYVLEEDDLDRLSKQLPIFQRRFDKYCSVNEDVPIYCSALEKLIKKGEYLVK